MKKMSLIKTALIIAIGCTGWVSEGFAEDRDVFFKQQHQPVYHAVKNKTLLLASQQIGLRSGIQFKVDSKIENDLVNLKLAGKNWREVVTQFLTGYNFSTVTKHGTLQSVWITGKNGSGKHAQTTTELNNQPTIEKPPTSKLPARYQNFAAGSVMPVVLPMKRIIATALGKQIVLDLPIGQYTVNHDDFVDDGNGAKTWMGYLEDEGKGYRVYLSQGEAGLMGNVTTPDGTYEIETVAGNTYLVDQQRAGLASGGYENDQAELPSNSGLGIANIDTETAAILASNGTIQPTAGVLPTATVTTIPVVDVMVLYTAVKQTPTYARQRIKYLVNVTNRAYKDSFINMQLRLVHTRKTNYVEKSNSGVALGDLQNNRGTLAGTSALRNQYGADLVLLFRPYYASIAGGCGIAYIGFSGGSGASPSTGFGVVSDGNSKDAPTNYYCGIQSFAHEVGHTLGNVHDREYSSSSGKFPYSYAWGINNQFGTIMSYKGPSVLLFATPKLPTQCAGHPCGYAAGTANASDQSRTINYTAPLVAKYKPKTIITPVIQ